MPYKKFPDHFWPFLRSFARRKKRVTGYWLQTDGQTAGRTEGWTDQPTDGPTDGRTDGWTDQWTRPLIEMRTVALVENLV